MPKCILGPVMGQRLVGTGLDLQEVITAHQPAEQELRRGASGQHKDAATSRTPGAKVGRDMEGLGEGVVPRSLSPTPHLLLTPLIDHNQSETRGQGCSFHKGQLLGCRRPRGIEMEMDTWREISTKVRCDHICKLSCT